MVAVKAVTPSERLWLIRRSLGMTQYEMANRMGMCRSYYVAMELGQRDVVFPRMEYSIKLRHHLMLCRRRLGKNLRAVARDVGVSHTHLLRMEDREDPRLLAFYQKFTFI